MIFPVAVAAGYHLVCVLGGSHSERNCQSVGGAFQIKVFFLVCVIVAEVYGAATVSRRILCVQAAPAALALILLLLA
jgi:uncharacterized membrane protein